MTCYPRALQRFALPGPALASPASPEHPSGTTPTQPGLPGDWQRAAPQSTLSPSASRSHTLSHHTLSHPLHQRLWLFIGLFDAQPEPVRTRYDRVAKLVMINTLLAPLRETMLRDIPVFT